MSTPTRTAAPARNAQLTFTLVRRLRRRTTALTTTPPQGMSTEDHRRVLVDLLFELRAAAFEVNAALAASTEPAAAVDDG